MVATAVNALKAQTTSLSNKHRKKWRGKDQNSHYSLRSTPTSGPPSEAVTQSKPKNVETTQQITTLQQPEVQDTTEAPVSMLVAMDTLRLLRDPQTLMVLTKLTDPQTLEVLTKLLKHSENLATQAVEQHMSVP